MYSKTNDRYRHIAILLLALVMVFSLMTPAIANADSTIGTPTTGSLTINKVDGDSKPISGIGFTLYKIMDITPGATAGEYADFSVEAPYTSVLKDVDPDALGNYSAAEIEALSAELLAAATGGVTMPLTDDAGKTTKTSLDVGYYMVVETTVKEGVVAGAPFFVAIPSSNNYDDTSGAATDWTYDVTVEPKNETIPLEKKIIDGNNLVDTDSSGVGDTVEFQIATTVPTFADEYYTAAGTIIYKLTDTMSDGLTFDTSAANRSLVSVDGTTETEIPASNYTWTNTTNGFEVSFTEDFLKNFKGKDIKVYYQATLNENALTGTTNPETNKVDLSYSNKPGSLSDYDMLDDEVKVYTFGLKIEKFGDAKALAGAEFMLYSDAECTVPVIDSALTTGADGMITFPNLKEGTYYLKETKSPDGYKLLANPIEVEIEGIRDNGGELTGACKLFVDGTEITATSGTFTTRVDSDNGNSTISVENHEGFSLPETGGMGIYIFLGIGIVGIVALSLALTRKKSGKKA
jgi:fimbrial isopeptide formation D2 family protein/LPXTG-motif cell wall-anchored protein